ncbi:Zn-dependent protease [Lipingzhangella halophila]|uniref:Zn-dependent protease n=1 Tax=Lipingzhangella halophila TaxID=1783352 RepID=A0A7W7RDW8_9ACTN|nr:site-2 protease family protein [Lipingzhangella halophila]MBB4929858.1 Zn-dependent protease [Lipingzhangella halophila]
MPTPEPVEADPSADSNADRNGALDPTESESRTTPAPGVGAPDSTGGTAGEALQDGTDTPADPPDSGDAPEAAATAAEPGSDAPSRTDLLPSPLIVLLLGITGLAGWLSWTRAELDWGSDGSTVYLPFVFVLSGWIVSVALHEFAHAALAYRFGDRALRGSGYLRLNPFRFRELFANLVLPVAFPILGAIGLTGPASYLDHTAVPGRGRRTLVALAGPATSLLLAAILAGVVSTLIEPEARTNNWALAGLMYLCYLNLTTALVSLLPVPGLDGFDAVAPYLPERAVRRGRAVALFGVIAVFGVLWFPQVNTAFIGLMLHVLALAGFPQIDVNLGMVVFQFWGL